MLKCFRNIVSGPSQSFFDREIFSWTRNLSTWRLPCGRYLSPLSTSALRFAFSLVPRVRRPPSLDIHSVFSLNMYTGYQMPDTNRRKTYRSAAAAAPVVVIAPSSEDGQPAVNNQPILLSSFAAGERCGVAWRGAMRLRSHFANKSFAVLRWMSPLAYEGVPSWRAHKRMFH